MALTLTTPVSTVTASGKLAVTATLSTPADTLQLLDNGRSVALLGATPSSTVVFLVDYAPLDSGDHTLELRHSATGVLTSATLKILVNIPFELTVVVRDPELILEGSPRWLAGIVNQAFPRLDRLYNRSPALFLDWATGDALEKLAVYSSPVLGVIPSQVMTADEWNRANGRTIESRIFGIPCAGETMTLWRRMQDQAAEKLREYILTGTFVPFSFNLI